MPHLPSFPLSGPGLVCCRCLLYPQDPRVSRGCPPASSKGEGLWNALTFQGTLEAVSRGYSGPPTSNLRILPWGPFALTGGYLGLKGPQTLRPRPVRRPTPGPGGFFFFTGLSDLEFLCRASNLGWFANFCSSTDQLTSLKLHECECVNLMEQGMMQVQKTRKTRLQLM